MGDHVHTAGGITDMLRAWRDRAGDETAADPALLRLVYDELRRRAHHYLQNERTGHTLQTTALVHETYLKLVEQRGDWKNRDHFFAVAATFMRRILIDYARTQKRARRGGADHDVSLDENLTIVSGSSAFDLLELNQALERLGEKDRRLAQVVELRFFAGLDVDDTAKALGVSSRTIKRDWRMAKAWLRREITN